MTFNYAKAAASLKRQNEIDANRELKNPWPVDDTPIDDLNACYQRPPIPKHEKWQVPFTWTDTLARDTLTDPPITEPPDLRPWKQPEAKHGVSREIALKRVFRDVELRLLSRDGERGETPYLPLVRVAVAQGKLTRWLNSIMEGKPPNDSEVTEALDYLIMWAMKNEWGQGW